LAKLMTPDSDAIKQASAELKAALQKQDGAAIPELCNVMAASQVPQIRQYAAVLLRKRFTKAKNWLKLADSDRVLIKSGCLQALVNEPEKSVKSSVAQLIAVLARHELAAKTGSGWPELMSFLDQAMKNSDPATRQLGYHCLGALCDTASEQMLVHIEYLSPLLAAALQDASDRTVGFYAVKALTHLAPFVGTDQIKFVQPLVPHMVVLIKALLAASDERACEAMEVFDDLMECEVTIVVPYIKPILDLMLSVAGEKSLEDPVRVKAIVFLGMVVKMKKKTVIKNNLVPRMIEVLFPIMCEPYDEEDEDEEEKDEESSAPSVCACQTLDQLAINLPPGKFLPHLLKYVQAVMTSTDPHQVRAAYHAMAVCVEGCSEYIKHHHLNEFLVFISNGVKSDVPLVRNAALYALGQSCEFLQPDINDHVKEFLPLLVNYLDTATTQLQQAGAKKVPGLDRIFYALEVFSESLGNDLLPYLEEMLKRLVQLIGPQFSNRVQELAISLIGTCATSVAEAIAPYAKDIIAHLQPYLTLECNEENQVLMMQSMDTLGSLARAIGPTGFAPELASECATLGLTLIDKYDDPDVRKCCYSLLASVASIAKEDMQTILPKLVPVVILSVASNEGISFEFKDEDSGLPVEDLSDDDDEAGDEDEISLGDDDDGDATEETGSELDKVKTISVENSFMEEKQQAIIALRDMCTDTGSAFHGFLNDAFDAVWKVIDYPDEDIRRASVDAITQFTVAYYKAGEPAAKEFGNSVALVVPKLCTMVKEDDEVGVASICLESISELLKECKGAITTAQPGFPEAIVEIIKSVMKSECACMDKDDLEGEGDEDEPEAEQDEALFDCAGEILPNLGAAMTPQTFLPVFQGLFPLLLKKTKKQCSPSERSFAIGSFAECMAPLSSCLEPFLPDLMQVFVGFMSDADKDVRNNAIFGLGELALNGGPGMVQHYPQILQTLSNHLAKGDEARCVDQIVGAVCRLVVANKAAVPLAEVVPVVLQHLPLKEDKEEYHMVYRCIETVYEDCRELILANLQKIADMSASLMNDKEANETKVKPLAKATVQALCKDHANEMKAALANQPQETLAKFEL